ncbi:MAG: glycosyltransferase family 4 protein [Aquihabitans sp.]
MSSVLHLLGPSTGGIRQHVAVLAEALEERGWDVSVAGPPGVMKGLGRGQHDVPIAFGPKLISAVVEVRRLARQVDVIHAHGLKAGWVAVAAGVGGRTVVTVHNLVLDEATGRGAPVLRRLELRLPRRVAATIAISSQIEEHLADAAKGRELRVVAPVGPEPVVTRDREDIRRELGVTDGQRLVILVGRLHPQKDVDNLIDAARGLPGDVAVVVVGSGPDEARLRKILAAEPDTPVSLVGPRPDAANYLAAADVVVSSARWEGFGLVIGEALRLGRPVVATDVGPVSTMVIDGRTGLLVPAEDPTALRQAITSLLDRPDHAHALGVQGARHMELTYPMSELVDGVEATYRAMLSQETR